MEFDRELTSTTTTSGWCAASSGSRAISSKPQSPKESRTSRLWPSCASSGSTRGQRYLLVRAAPLDAAQPATTSVVDLSPARGDGVATVRAAFQAFADPDLDTLGRMWHPQSILRPYADVQTGKSRWRLPRTCRAREVLPGCGRPVGRTAPLSLDVLVIACASGHSTTAETLWIYRMRDGLIASVISSSIRQKVRPRSRSPLGTARPPRRAAEPTCGITSGLFPVPRTATNGPAGAQGAWTGPFVAGDASRRHPVGRLDCRVPCWGPP